MPRSLLVALGLLLALPAAAASAAPPWSEPQNLSAPHTFISEPALGFAGDGTALAAWRWQDEIREQARSGQAAATRAPGAGAFAPERRAVSGRVGEPVLYASSRAAIAIERPVESIRDPRSELRVAFGNAAGVFGASRRVVKRPRIASPVLAGNARGDLALACFEDRGTTSDRVYLAFRRAGGAFGRPVLLETGRIRSVSAAVGPRGDLLVAWDARGVVRARVKTARGFIFGRAQTIRSRPTYFADLRTALSSSGRAYVAWGAQFRSEGGDTGPVYFQAAVRPAGAPRFRDAELLEQEPDHRSANPPDLAVDPGSGRAIVGWTGYDGATNRVRVAETDPSGRFSIRQELSAPGVDAVLDDVEASPASSRVAVWTAFLFPTERRRVQGAFARFGERFGAPEEISTGEQSDTARAAFDAGTDRLSAVWVSRPAGSVGPLSSIRTYLQGASRTG